MQSLPHAGHVAGRHVGEGRLVDTASVLLEDDLVELHAERVLALPLERQRLDCLPAATIACDRAAIHGPRIVP